MRAMDTQVQSAERGLVLPPMNSTVSSATAATTATNTDTDTRWRLEMRKGSR